LVCRKNDADIEICVVTSSTDHDAEKHTVIHN